MSCHAVITIKTLKEKRNLHMSYPPHMDPHFFLPWKLEVLRRDEVRSTSREDKILDKWRAREFGVQEDAAVMEGSVSALSGTKRRIERQLHIL